MIDEKVFKIFYYKISQSIFTEKYMKIIPISSILIKKQNFITAEKSKESSRSENPIFGFPSQQMICTYKKAAIIPFGHNEDIDYSGNINLDYFGLPSNASPDRYQIEAAQKLDRGDSVLVSAPTGTGKTAIAQYIISKNLDEGYRTFYTTPLKALSNQKLLEFRKLYGEENVGIMTGDRQEKTNAPIIIMTTEVFKNMAFDQYFNNAKNIGDNVKTIIFDEFHYLGDPQRGVAWEESVIFSPPQLQLLGLSATIGNDAKVASWLQSIRNRPVSLVHVPTQNRHVPLLFMEYDTHAKKLREDPNQIFARQKLALSMPNGQADAALFAQLLDTTTPMALEKKYECDNPRQKHSKPTIIKVKPKGNVEDFLSLVNILASQKKLPAIFFVFSKRSCNYYADTTKHGAYIPDLNTENEKQQIAAIVRRYREKYKYLGGSFDYDSLLKGYAVHHAGIMPVEKELIEELFNKKLIKVVYATETLAAGINMPAKTVVISSPDKPFSTPNGLLSLRILSANEYHQMAGRAGRRGIDTEGFVVNLSTNKGEARTYSELVHSSANPVISHFNPSYSLIANYHKYNPNPEALKDIFSKSFVVHIVEDDRRKNAKISQMKQLYEAKADIMKAEGFLKEKDNGEMELTSKGMLLQNVSGFPQIPIINLITSFSLDGISPEKLVYLAASIVCGQYNKNQSIEDVSDKIDDIVEGSPATKYIKRDTGKLRAIGCEQIKMPDCDDIELAFQEYNTYINRYRDNLEKHELTEEYPLDINPKLGAHIYSFAALNENTKFSSIENWKNVIQMALADCGINDEGTFYNTVNQTIELLSQMTDVCDEAKEICELNDEDEEYYYDSLSKNLKTAVLLLKQKPVRDNNLEL